MSTQKILSLLCVVPLSLLSFCETSYGQVCEGASAAAASVAPSALSSGGTPSVSISGNSFFNLMRFNQFLSAPSRQAQMQQQQRMMFLQQQWMLQQRELAKKQEAEKAKQEEEKEKEEALAKLKEKKKKPKTPNDGLTADQRIRRSLLQIERRNELNSGTIRRR